MTLPPRTPHTPRTGLTLYPAIDIKGGQCVRLLHGEMHSATVYNDSPGGQARLFAEAGFERLHIVDLDGAFTGKSENRAAVREILANAPMPAQLGGGIRTLAAVEGWLDAGIARVILGSAAVHDPEFVRAAAAAFPGQVAIGVDARDGRVKTDGWAGDSDFDVLDIARRFEDAGIAALIYTDIGRDGALGGVNVGATAALARALSIPVIASGGVASLADISALMACPEGIEGVIIGRALYDGRIDPHTGLALARGEGASNA